MYWMTGLRPEGNVFGQFLGLVLLTTNSAFSLGYLISCATPSVQVALQAGPAVVLPFMLFGGFFVNLSSIPVYFQWISYISFFRYGYEAVSIVLWRGYKIGCDAGEKCLYATGEDVLSNLSMDPNNLYFDIGLLFALAVGFRLLAFIFLWRVAQVTKN
jgi:ABC-type transport system involved in multi-copper enzyme maturation permease subunit